MCASVRPVFPCTCAWILCAVWALTDALTHSALPTLCVSCYHYQPPLIAPPEVKGQEVNACIPPEVSIISGCWTQLAAIMKNVWTKSALTYILHACPLFCLVFLRVTLNAPFWSFTVQEKGLLHSTTLTSSLRSKVRASQWSSKKCVTMM